MAKVNWSAGIDSVSGALAKPSKSGQHSCNKMLLGTHRVAETTSSDCNRIYLRGPIKRSTPPTQKELQQRAKFAQLAQAVADRSQDLSKVSQDQEAYLAQKDQPGGKTTFKSYLWSVCKAELENA